MRLPAWLRAWQCVSLAGCALLLIVLCVSLALFLLSPGCFSFTAWFLASVNVCSYFLRSTICLSVRLLFRVFLPNVGKAQGVCG